MTVNPLVGVFVVGLLFYAVFSVEAARMDARRLELRLDVCEYVPAMELRK